MKYLTRSVLVLMLIIISTAPSFAQKYEIHPYSGGFWATDFANAAEFKKEGLYGARGGVYVTNNFEVEGNFGYINHFEFAGTDPEARGVLWDVNGSYRFIFERTPIQPFATFGVGGLTAVLEDQDRVLLDTRNRPVTLEDGDTFFALNYGGGFRLPRLWGPLGFRLDGRGRTVPNFFSESNHRFELTAGVFFSWGGR